MTETLGERQVRLWDALAAGHARFVYERSVGQPWKYQLEALLATLEPPVADMVRRGIEELTVSVVETEESTVHLVHMYRPRSEA